MTGRSSAGSVQSLPGKGSLGVDLGAACAQSVEYVKQIRPGARGAAQGMA